MGSVYIGKCNQINVESFSVIIRVIIWYPCISKYYSIELQTIL